MRRNLCTLSAFLYLGLTFARNFDTSFIQQLSLPNSTDYHLRTKCVENGAGEEEYQALKLLPWEFNACLEPYINFTVVQEEIEESKKTGSMDIVFSKYCKRYPHIYKCLHTLSEKSKPCLNLVEREIVAEIMDFVPVLKEYLCFNDGIRMALFISQGGFECMESKRDKLEVCANETIGTSFEELPEFWFLKKECNDLFNLRDCVYRELTKCKQNIPANVVDSFFKFLKKYLACNGKSEEFLKREESANRDKLTRGIIVIVFLMIVAALVYKLVR